MATDGKDSTWNWNQQFEIWNWAYYLMVNLTYSLQSTRNSIEITWKYNCEKNLYLNLTFLVAALMWLFAWNTRIKCRPLVGCLIVSFCLFVCNSTCLSICPSALVLAWFSSFLAVCLSVCPSVFGFLVCLSDCTFGCLTVCLSLLSVSVYLSSLSSFNFLKFLCI